MSNTALFVFFYLFLYITIFGALNWGLVGAFQFNLVEFLSNKNNRLEKGLYILVGFSAIIVFILSIIVMGDNSEHFKNHDLIEEYDSHTTCQCQYNYQ